MGRPPDDRIALLARHAAAHTDDQIRVQLLEVLDAPQIVENALLRLLAYRAGIEEDDVGFFRVIGLGGRLSAAPSTSAILSESYSFIWHPKVRM